MRLFRRNKNFSDEEIQQIFESGGEQESQALKYLYRTHYGSIRALVIGQGGNEAEAEDVFQEALIVLYEQIKNGKFIRTAKIKTYLYTIAKNNWINKLKRKNRQVDLKHIEYNEKDKEPSPNEILLEKEMIDFAQSIIGQLGTDCQKILDLSLYKKTAMKEIAKIMDYSNAQVARNKKHKCLGQLKKIILESAKLSRLAKELKNE